MGGPKPAAQAAAQNPPVPPPEPPKKKGRGGYFGADPNASYGSKAVLGDGTTRNTFVTGGR